MISRSASPRQCLTTKGRLCAAVMIFIVPISLGMLVFYDLWVSGQVTPPSGDMNIREFAQSMPPPDSLTEVDLHGSTFIVWIGPEPKTIVPLSGPPCYVFATNGVLLDWSHSVGDDFSVSEYLTAAKQGKTISLADALSIVP